MNLQKARQLTPGRYVHCPPDRGEPGHTGKVVSSDSATAAEQSHMGGPPFIWVEVQHPAGRKSVWPSNRLQ